MRTIIMRALPELRLRAPPSAKHAGPRRLGLAVTMPLGARCNHCHADGAVVPMSDYQNDRFLYFCVHCGWWGFDPLRMDSPPTDEIERARKARHDVSTQLKRR